jgi:hypothetical protein
MKRWAPRLGLLLAAVAEVGGILPLALLTQRLLVIDPEGSGSGFHLPLSSEGLPALLLVLVWLGGWAIGSRKPERQTALTVPLLALALLLGWAALPASGRPASPLHVSVFPALLPPLIAAWWGGSQMGLRGLSWQTAYSGLHRSGRLGMISFCLSILTGGKAGATAFTAPLLLFGAGLMLLYSLRTGLIAGDPPGEGSTSGMTVFAVGPLLGIALLAIAVTPQGVGLVLRLIWRAISPVIQAILAIVLLPFGYLAGLLVRFLQPLFARGAEKAAEEMAKQALPPEQLLQPEPFQTTAALPYQQLIVAVLLLLLLFALLRRLRRQERPKPVEIDPEEERSGPGLWKGLLGDLQALLGRHRGEMYSESLPPDHPRQLLRRVQAWGAARSRSRQEAETPARYAKALAPLLPTGVNPADLQALTQAYETARYGDRGPTPEEMARAQLLLQRLEQDK